LFAFALLFAASAPPSRAASIAVDDFDSYSAGPLSGANGGAGWGAAYSAQAGASVVSDAPVTYMLPNGAILGGGNALKITGADVNTVLSRTLATPVTDGSDVFVSFVFRIHSGRDDEPDGAEVPTSVNVLTAWVAKDSADDNAVDTMGVVGANGRTTARINNSSLTASPVSTPLVFGKNMLFVVKYTGWDGASYKACKVWLNPTPDDEASSNAAVTVTKTATAGGSDAFNGIRVRTTGLNVTGGRHFLVDALRVGASWADVVGTPTGVTAPPADLPRVVVFGDSLSSGGPGNNPSTGPNATPAYPKKTWITQLAPLAGYPDIGNHQVDAVGTNYAVGGKTAVDMVGYVTDFLNDYNGAADPRHLYVLWCGANDISHAMQDNILSFLTNGVQLCSTAADTAAATMEAQIRRLAAAGATRFYWIDLPDLSLTPSVDYYTAQYGSSFKSMLQNALRAGSQAFNTRMATALASLATDLPGITIHTFSAWDYFNQIVANPASHGFANATQGASLSTEYGGAGLTATATIEANTYLFWDGVHPTSHGHNLLANTILADWTTKSLLSTPVPPAVDAVWCASASPAAGDLVSLAGSNLSGLSAVTIGGFAAEIVGATDSFAKVLLPAGAAAGDPIVVTTAPSTNTSAYNGAWTTAALPLAPTVASITPATAAPGDSVTIAGANLDAVSAVSLIGADAAGAVTITAQTAASLTFTIPAGTPDTSAATIALATPAGAYLALEQLKVKTAPANPDLIAEDNFDSYTPGLLAGQTAGGAGWGGATSAWGTMPGVTISTDDADRISYTLDNGTVLGSDTSGAVLVLSSTAATSTTTFESQTAIYRTFETAPTAGSEVFVSFIFKIKDLSKTDGASFSSGNNVASWAPHDGGASSNDTIAHAGLSGRVCVRIQNTNTQNVNVTLKYGQTYFMVAKYFGWNGSAYRSVQVWLDPKTTDEAAASNTITAKLLDQTAGGSSNFNGLRVRSYNLTTIDTEAGAGRYHVVDAVRVGKTWASVVGLPSPAVTGITPTAVQPGDTITITGAYLTGATVTIGGLDAAVTPDDTTPDLQLTATVPATIGAGAAVPVVLTTAGGTVTAAQTLTVTLPAPSVTDIVPTSIHRGGSITITGANLANATVTIGGVEAVLTENTATTIVATVPDEVTIGAGAAVTVTTGGGNITATQTLTIARLTQPALVITDPGAKITTDAAFTLATTGGAGTGSVTFTRTAGDDSIATVTAAGLVTPVGAGSVTVTAQKAGDNDYNASAVSAPLTITIASTMPAPSVTGIFPASIHRGGSITITGANLANATVTIGGIAAVLTENTATTIVATVPGTVALGANAAVSVTTSGGNITAAQTLTIVKLAQSALAITDPGAKTVADAAFQLATTGGSGSGAVTYALVSGAAATVSSDGLVTITAAGSVTIRATKAADDDYDAATAERTLTIAKLTQPALVITDPGAKTTADGAFTLATTGGAGTGSVTFTRTVGDDSIATVTAAGLVTPVGAGSITVTAQKAGDDNYDPSAVSAPVAISIVGDPDNFTTVAAGPGWVPLAHSLDIAEGGVFDFSTQGHLDAPAGKHGALRVTDGHFEFANRPGQRARFWGVNIVQMANFLNTHAQADALAARLARSGYNTARLHLFDEYLVSSSLAASGNSWDLDATRLEKLDYLFHALKQQGIYINIDLYGSRGFSLAECESFGADITQSIAKNNCKGLFAISDAALESWKKFATNLLTHTNPYTGLTWAADPALIGICPVNENPAHRDSVSSAIPEPVSSLFKTKYTAQTGKTTYKGPDWNRWVFENAIASNDAMAAHIRSLGSKALITTANNTVAAALTHIRSRYDYVDGHLYWDHPTFPGSSWSFPMNFSQNSATATSAYSPAHMMPIRVFGKPFTSTEFHFCRPNRYRSEGALLIPAYASLQDWDAMYNFDYAKDIAGATTGAADNYFALGNDPVGLVGDRVSALLFLRGDIAPATTAIAYAVNDTEAYANDSSGNPGREFDANFRHAGLIARIGSLPGEPAAVLAAHPELAAVATGTVTGIPENSSSKIYVATSGFVDRLRATGVLPAATTGIVSDTGELTLSDGNFRAVTPRGEHFVLTAGASLAGSRVSIANGDVFGAVSVTALKTASDAGAPTLATARRILVTHLTDSLTTGMTFATAERKQLTAWGALPHLVRAGAATLTIVLPEGGWTAWAVDITGARTGAPLPLTLVGPATGALAGAGNTHTLEINTAGPGGATATFAYELALTTPPPPVINTLSQAAAFPGDTLTITGQNLADATVTIAGLPAAIVSASNTEIVITIPAGAGAGTVPVVVTTPGGATASSQTVTIIRTGQLLAADDFDSYAPGAALHALNGGAGWDSAGYDAKDGAAITAAETVSYTLDNGAVIGGGNALRLDAAADPLLLRRLSSRVNGGADIYASLVFTIKSTKTGEPDGQEISSTENIFLGIQALDTSPSGTTDALAIIGTGAGARVGARVNNETACIAAAPPRYGRANFLVIRYIWDTAAAAYRACQVWLNPSAGDERTENPSVTVTKTAADGGSASFDGLRFRTLGLAATDGRYYLLDALRIGTAWSDVVPAGDVLPDTGAKLVVFGDSLSSGGEDGIPLTSPAPTATNGGYPRQTWVQQLSELAGYGILENGYPQRAGGTNYARSGDTTGADLTTQVDTYLADVANVSSAQNIFVLWLGANDVSAAVASSKTQILSAPQTFISNVSAALPAAVDRMETQIRRLIATGAAKILWADLPDLGASPLADYYSTYHADGSDAAKTALASAMTAACAAFNARLDARLDALRAEFPAVSFTKFAASEIYAAVKAAPATYGITDVTTGELESNDHFYRDRVHPTSHGHTIIAQAALETLRAANLLAAPGVTAISIPRSPAVPGDTLTITGDSFNGLTQVLVGDTEAEIIAVTGSIIKVKLPAGAAQNAPVTVKTTTGQTTASLTWSVPAPAITGITPLAAHPGDTLAITGENLDGATVTIGGLPAEITAAAANYLLVTIPAGADGGNLPVTVTTPAGAATAAQTLAVSPAPPPAPVIGNILPLAAHPGNLITITGENLDGATVTIGGLPVEIITNTGTLITVQAPAGLASGPVAITTSGGSVSSTRQVVIKPDTGDSSVLSAPAGVVVASANTGGTLYVSDFAQHTIHVIDSGAITTLAGSPGLPGLADGAGAAARFNRPRGLAINRDGLLVVVDSGNNLLRHVTAGGVVTTTGTEGAGAPFAAPVAAASVDGGDGATYIADAGSHLIKKITASGEVSIVAGSGAPGAANGPLLGAQFNSPAGVAVDVTGAYLYIADTGNHAIRLVDLAADAVTTFAGLPGAPGTADGAPGAARFNSPSGIIVDGDGDVYVADTGNSRIRLIAADGALTVSTLAGGAPGFVDGAGTAARFNAPSALALADDGALYVADTGNHAIRRIAPDDDATVETLVLKSPSASPGSVGGDTGGGGGGGGGAPLPWTIAALAALLIARKLARPPAP
jgi:phospholipase/lecithinase/hemolysin/sugar lactone lactonase YvrE